MTLFLMQDARSQADQVRAAMAASLEQQRASVRKQAQSLGSAMIPWTASTLSPVIPCDPIPQPELAKMIEEVSKKQGIDAALVKEVARQESGFRPCAVSSKGAEGLMQLMPATQEQMQVDDPFDPKQSLEAGSKLLKQLLDRYHGDLPLALSAYNAGAGRVDQAGGVPDIPQTRNYVLSILTRFLQ
jgi:soluble lytic murein transglycosylase-like protein